MSLEVKRGDINKRKQSADAAASTTSFLTFRHDSILGKPFRSARCNRLSILKILALVDALK
jgi:hypothetical protein